MKRVDLCGEYHCGASEAVINIQHKYVFTAHIGSKG